MPELKTAVDKVRTALCEHGILVHFRVKNHKLDYSIMNRPEPELSGVSDHALATAIVDAVKRFPLKRQKRASSLQRETVARSDGREVKYRDAVNIDWNDGMVHSTASKDLTLQVLAAVVENLMSDAERTQARKAGLN